MLIPKGFNTIRTWCLKDKQDGQAAMTCTILLSKMKNNIRLKTHRKRWSR